MATSGLSMQSALNNKSACMQAARSDAQAVSVTSVPEVNVTMQTGPFNPIILYGIKPDFSATILSNGSLPSTTACPFLWMNGTQTISVLPQFSQASTSSAIAGGLVRKDLPPCTYLCKTSCRAMSFVLDWIKPELRGAFCIAYGSPVI